MKWIRKLFGGEHVTNLRGRPGGVQSLRVGESEFSQPLPELEPGEPEYEVEIPAPATVGSLSQQYAQAPGSLGSFATAHVTRMLEIFSDSIRIALESKKPDIAEGRYKLSLVTYHEILAHAAPSPDLDYVTRLMKRVVALYPANVRVNEAIGCMDKVSKLKSAKGKLKWLFSAREILNSIPDGDIVDGARLERVKRQLDEQVALLEPT